jgi:hypothetical protein
MMPKAEYARVVARIVRYAAAESEQLRDFIEDIESQLERLRRAQKVAAP